MGQNPSVINITYGSEALSNCVLAIEIKFLNLGFEALYQFGKEEKITEILNNQDNKALQELCEGEL